MYTVPVRDSEYGYYDGWLWLPKTKVNPSILKTSLTLDADGQEPIRAFREAPRHIGIPRAKIDPEKLGYEVVDLRPRSYAQTRIESRIVLDKQRPERSDQSDAFRDMCCANGGILNLACGLGKTVIALHLIAHLKVPALIIGYPTHLEQWKQEINRFLEIDGDLGWVQGNPKKWTWRAPITLASINSLARHANSIPLEMAAFPGVVVFDEVHHLGGAVLSRTAPLFLGRRYGLTATVDRPDGRHLLYLWHLGPVFHSNLEQDMIPTVTFVASPTQLDLRDRETRRGCCDVTGEFHFAKTCAYLSTREKEIRLAKMIIDEGLARDRTLMVIALSTERLRVMHELYPNSGFINRTVPQKERLSILLNNRLVFGTTQMLRESLSKKSLDALISLTEFSSDNLLQQCMGRTQRRLPGKKMPKVIFIWHHKVGPLAAAGRKLMRILKSWNIPLKIVGEEDA